MRSKLFLLCSLIICVAFFVNMTDNSTSNHGNRTLINPNVKHFEDVISAAPTPYLGGQPIISSAPQRTVHYSGDATVTTGEVDPAGRTYYDYVSNGNVRMCVQDPNNASNIFAVMMTDPVGNSGGGFPDRRTSVFQSNDEGATWSFVSLAPAIRSGYPSVDVLANGNEIVTCHTLDGGAPVLISQAYVDAAPGAGSFTRLGEPPWNGTSEPIWGTIVATSNVTNARKFFIINSIQSNDSSFYNTGTSLTSSAYSGFSQLPNCENAQSYSAARGSDGRIGIIYVANVSNDPTHIGSIFLRESTDDGLTFGSPTTVWNCNFATDSMGAIRGCDLVYKGTTPCAAFGLDLLDPTGGFFLGAVTAKVMFWSAGTGAVLLDTCSMMRAANPQNDVMFADCRAVIGRSTDNNALFVAWERCRPDSGADGNNFFDVYTSWSTDNGATWGQKTVVNTASPVRDNRYVSISQTNAAVTGNYWAHLIYISDSIPGSFVQGAPQSLAHMMYANVNFGPIGIRNIGSEVPKAYSLNQNYPNPFNPSTKIRFDLPKNSFVSLNVYDVTGKLVGNLINENLSAGTKEYDWNAVNMPSGVYFYTLRAGDFTQTKKMILVK